MCRLWWPLWAWIAIVTACAPEVPPAEVVPQDPETTVAEDELILTGRFGRGSVQPVQDMMAGFASGFVEGSAREVGGVTTSLGDTALVRWKSRQGDVIQDCYGWVRGAMGVESCGPPGRRPGAASYSSETPSDIEPELRQHSLFFEAPPDIASVIVITKDGFRVRAPVFGGLALAEWRGHSEWACVVGLHRDGSQVVINGVCPKPSS